MKLVKYIGAVLCLLLAGGCDNGSGHHFSLTEPR